MGDVLGERGLQRPRERPAFDPYSSSISALLISCQALSLCMRWSGHPVSITMRYSSIWEAKASVPEDAYALWYSARLSFQLLVAHFWRSSMRGDDLMGKFYEREQERDADSHKLVL
ncbi:hypothetical protein B0H11DRAFT_1856818 [Mycena galericulata]|nr:hypothetical protein B0H11DRAFT_1856818 [Mycena galericulata]